MLNKSCRLFQLGLREVLENNSYSPLKVKETIKSTVLLEAQNLQKMYPKLKSMFVILYLPTHPYQETCEI